MGALDRFYRQGRDIFNRFKEIYSEDPVKAEEYLNEQFTLVRGIVKKHVLHKINTEYPDLNL